MRDGGENTSVTLWLDDEDKLTRKKGKENTYHVNGKPLKAFGTDVPDEVRDTLKIDEVNFSGQHDSPFWFDLTPGEVARRLNDIVDLNVIDDVLKELGSRLNRNRSEQTIIKQRMIEAEKELEELDHVDALDRKLCSLEEQANSLAEGCDRLLELHDCIEVCKYNEKDMQEGKKREEDGVKVIELGHKAKGFQDKLQRLSCIRMAIGEHQKDVDREVPDIAILEAMKVGVIKTEEERRGLRQKIRSIELLEKSVEIESRAAKTAEKEYKEAFGEECPLCGSPMKDNKS
jgi:hypothetical protein